MDNKPAPRTSAEELGTLAENEPPTLSETTDIKSVTNFVASLCFCGCHTPPLHIAHWLQMFASVSHSIPWSSSCRIHELSVVSDFFDFFINTISLLFIIFSFQHFLLLFTFLEEVDNSHTLRQDQQLLHEHLLAQNRNFREIHEESLSEMKELKRFQGSTFDSNSIRKLFEDRDTILELIGKIQELQNEINCMNDSRHFQDAESVRSGHSHVTSQPVFPTSANSWWNAKPFFRNADPQRWAAKHLGHARISGNVFCRSSCVFYSTFFARVESLEL